MRKRTCDKCGLRTDRLVPYLIVEANDTRKPMIPRRDMTEAESKSIPFGQHPGDKVYGKQCRRCATDER